MTARQFLLRIEQPPREDQICGLFAVAHDCCVEVGAFRRWAAVFVDREAPSMAVAVATAIGDLDAAGLVPIDVGPDEELVTVPLIAMRLECHPRRVSRWASEEGRECGFPDPEAHQGTEPWFRWSEVALWAARRLGITLADPAPVVAAANLALRLRAVAPAVEDVGAIVSLIGHDALGGSPA